MSTPAPFRFSAKREQGASEDDWPALFEKVASADILVIGTPIWLGEKSSVCTRVVDRLYGNSGQLNDKGQSVYYGRVAGCIVTGNEDGAKHCAMNVLSSLQHLGYAIPPQANSCWLGEAGPGSELLGPRPELRGRRGRARERVHPEEHRLRRLEPHAPRGDAQARGRLPE